MGQPFSKISKNSIKTELPEPGLFVNVNPLKFTAKTPVTRRRDREASSVRITADATTHRVTTNSKVGSQLEDASTYGKSLGGDDWEIQCPSQLPYTSVPVPDKELDSKRSPIDKILLYDQALALYNFRIGEGILTHMCEQQEDNLAIDVLSQMIHNLREAERTHFA
ncbi:MAG: hypothetical protein EZS28_037581 [Streblomastix strix]|uniref:Uncharacterized protein n=1 Tax=Streblomastix strix TaxID=222440 RepID=A0A5J4UAG3_9EUKA|nr:MAG: hypothetical protein EZS28_037581 [Streblomastix strix]